MTAALRDLHRQLIHDFDVEDWPAMTRDLQQIRHLDVADYERLERAFAKYFTNKGEIAA